MEVLIRNVSIYQLLGKRSTKLVNCDLQLTENDWETLIAMIDDKLTTVSKYKLITANTKVIVHFQR